LLSRTFGFRQQFLHARGEAFGRVGLVAEAVRGLRRGVSQVGRGWYSNTARGMRRKAAEAAAAAEQPTAASAVDAASVPVRSRASQTWAMLIKRVYEFDPLVCAKLWRDDESGCALLSHRRPT